MAKLFALLYYPMSLEDDCEGVASVSVLAASEDVNKLAEYATTMEQIGTDGVLIWNRVNNADGGCSLMAREENEPDVRDSYLTYFNIDPVEVL